MDLVSKDALRVETVTDPDDSAIVVKVFAEHSFGITSTTTRLYQGYIPDRGKPFLDEHSHGDAPGHVMHVHPHEGPHVHPEPEPVEHERIMLNTEVEGVDRDLFLRLLSASASHSAEPKPVRSESEVEKALDEALVRALFGYFHHMPRQEAEDRIRDRLVRASDMIVGSMVGFIEEIEEAAKAEDGSLSIDPSYEATIAVLQGEYNFSPDGPEARSSLARTLKAAGTPQFHYVADHDSDDAYVAGPYYNASDCAEARRNLEKHPAYEEVNLAVYEGYRINNHVVSV